MKKTIFFLFLVLKCVGLSAQQKNFIKEGYIIPSMTKDTLLGEIKDEEWSNSPKEVLFRKINESKFKNYTINDISGFGFLKSREDFVNKKIKYVASKDYDSKIIIDSTIAFLKVIAKGRISLYQFLESPFPEKFFVEKNGSVQELLHHSFIKTNRDGSSSETNIDAYQQTLEILTNDVTQLKKQKVNYTASDLQMFLNSYNTIFDKKKIILHSNKDKPTTNLAIGISGQSESIQEDGSRNIFHAFFVGLRINSPKRYGNSFVMIGGQITINSGSKEIKYGGFYGSGFSTVSYFSGYPIFVPSVLFGTHFGNRIFRPMGYLGLNYTRDYGLGFKAGVGISYKRVVMIELGSDYLLNLNYGFKTSVGTNSSFRPHFGLKYFINLSKKK